MSIISGLAQIDPATRIYAVVGGAVVLSLLLAGWAGVYRGASVAGPERLTEEDRLGPLWLTVMIAFYSMYLPASIYHLTYSPIEPTTAPATQLVLSPRSSALLSMAQPAVVLLAIFLANSIMFPSWRTRLGLMKRFLPRGVTAGLIAIAIVLPVMFVVAQITQEFWNWMNLEHPQAHALLRAMNEDRDASVQWFVAISAVVLAPVAEELLFRGILQTAMLYALHRRNPGPSVRWAAILITSAIFTVYHPELWMMPPIFVLSMCLGYLYERTGNLWSCMLLHAGFNASNLIFWIQSRH